MITNEPDTFTAAGTKRWSITRLRSILSNKKHKGDALLQKSYTADFLSKRQVANQGGVPQYYVTGNHEAIISPAVWDFVQAELAKTAKFRRTQHRTRPFSSTLVCEECGHFFGSKTRHAGSKYEAQTRCTTGHVDNERPKQMLVEAVR